MTRFSKEFYIVMAVILLAGAYATSLMSNYVLTKRMDAADRNINTLYAMPKPTAMVLPTASPSATVTLAPKKVLLPTSAKTTVTP